MVEEKTSASLCTGFGVIDMSAEERGYRTVFQSEIDPFARHVLKYYYPHATLFGDARDIDGTQYRGKIRLLSAGFPCQPISVAGKQRAEDDPRYLWPTVFRISGEIRPDYCVFENVAALNTISQGMVFYKIKSDLESIGYSVLRLLLPACGANGPHERYRHFIIAYLCGDGRTTTSGHGEAGRQTEAQQGKEDQWKRYWQESDGIGRKGLATYTQSTILQGAIDTWAGRTGLADYYQARSGAGGSAANSESQRVEGGGSTGEQESGSHVGSGLPYVYPTGDYWAEFPTQSPIRGRNDGLASGVSFIPFLDGDTRRFTANKWWKGAISALGNAIVKPVADILIDCIDEFDRVHNTA